MSSRQKKKESFLTDTEPDNLSERKKATHSTSSNSAALRIKTRPKSTIQTSENKQLRSGQISTRKRQVLELHKSNSNLSLNSSSRLMNFPNRLKY